MRVANGQTANISYLIIAGYALLGRTQAIQALALSWLFSMLNPALVPDVSAASIGRYLVIAAAFISVFWRRARLFDNKLQSYTLLLGMFMLGHSLLFSTVVDVSVLKVIVWVVVTVTLLAAWRGLSTVKRTLLFNQLQLGLIVLLVFSMPFLAIPSIGFERNGHGFQGLLSHPQVFGPTAALVGALLGGSVLQEPRPRWRDLALFGMCVVLILFSEARTAGLALLLGLFGSAELSPVFAGKLRRQMLPGLRSRRFQVVGLVVVVAALVSGPVLEEILSKYLIKHSNAANFVDAAEASRGALVYKMLDNIQAYPFTGIGFGIASHPALMKVERDPFFGLPLSAQIEKGVLPLAVVEELGVVGALAVGGWLFIVLRRGARVGVSRFAVLLTLLLVNFGECMFFSVGGMGMLLLILLTGAVTSDHRTKGMTCHA